MDHLIQISFYPLHMQLVIGRKALFFVASVDIDSFHFLPANDDVYTRIEEIHIDKQVTLLGK